VLFNFRIELKGESLRNDCIKQEKQKLNEFKGIIAGLNFKTTPKHNTDNMGKLFVTVFAIAPALKTNL